jgi:hypothetical protein
VIVELLYFDGCLNHEALLPHLQEIIDRAGVHATIEQTRVDDDAAAQSHRFLGSPTVRVNGRDVEPGADQRDDFGIKCRLYPTPDGLRGTPIDDWLVAALAERNTA